MKKFGRKEVTKKNVFSNRQWTVVNGRIVRGRGRPSAKKGLFKLFCEKIPVEAFKDVKKEAIKSDGKIHGIYIAHDSMTFPRYIGRGDIFGRLRSRFKTNPNELKYFSFYVVENKQHVREIETLLIHITGSLLEFNERKKRIGINNGSILDFEPGTVFFERHKKKGRKAKRKPKNSKEAF
jgi:hypothetical protein